MKHTFFLVMLIILTSISFLILSCSDDNINQPNPDNGLVKISGTLTDWNYGIGKSLSMYTNPPYVSYLVGNSTISTTGDFSIQLSSPPISELKPVIELESLRNKNSLIISDTTVKGCFSKFLIKQDSTSFFIGEAIPSSNQVTFGEGHYFVKYIYLEKAMSIIGKLNDTIFGDSIEVEYKLNYTSGWNIRINKIVEIAEVDSLKSFRKNEITNKPEPDMIFKTHIFGKCITRNSKRPPFHCVRFEY
jgi:hypothetical protein